MKKTLSRSCKTALIIGAGIAGASAANNLNRFGVDVHLVEKEPVIGGHAADMGCKAADVCLRCNVCVAADMFASVLRSPKIRIRTRCRLVELKPGLNGFRYRAVLDQAPNFIRRELCIGCGECVAVCPAKCLRLAHPAFDGAIPSMEVEACLRTSGKPCVKCAKACPVHAIDLKEKRSCPEVDADVVIVATGHEPFDPSVIASYGYGALPDVITGVDAERQLAQTGRITRPSDGQPPKRVAFIQCVGSRTEEIHRQPEDTDYCSAVCCAYALRLARKIQHAVRDTAVSVFYMDIQNFGKGFQQFYHACADKMNFIRSRPYGIKAGPDGAVRIKYAPETGGGEGGPGVTEQDFDLVVLGVGIRPCKDSRALADLLGIAVDARGFFGLKTASAMPDLQKEGILVIGTVEAPRDIAGCMAQAEAVSSVVLEPTFKNSC